MRAKEQIRAGVRAGHPCHHHWPPTEIAEQTLTHRRACAKFISYRSRLAHPILSPISTVYRARGVLSEIAGENPHLRSLPFVTLIPAHEDTLSMLHVRDPATSIHVPHQSPSHCRRLICGYAVANQALLSACILIQRTTVSL